jgi:aspartate aminotransferase
MPAFYLSQRVRQIAVSPNAVANQRAQELAAKGVSVLNLTVGEPDFDTPDAIKEAGIAAIRRGDTKYTPVAGTAALREAIRAKLRRENGLDYPVEQIIAANGAKQVIFNAFAATLDEGTEVVIPAPYWPSFPDIVRINGGRPVFVTTPPDSGFKLDAQALEAAITPNTRWVVLNTPSNPTGAVYGESEMATVAAVLRRHPHVLLLLDEIYEHIRFDLRQRVHFLAVAPDLADRVLVVNGVSKTYAMTGWRLGYGAGPLQLVQAMAAVQSQASSGAGSISQAAALAALSGDQSFVAGAAAAYATRRDALVSGLAAIEGIDVTAPDGAFFVYAGCAGLLGRITPTGSALRTDTDVVEYLLTSAGVAAVDGTSFGLSPYVRFSLAVSTATIQQACDRIQRACTELLSRAEAAA